MPIHLPARWGGRGRRITRGTRGGLRERDQHPPPPLGVGAQATDTSFISEELLSRATRDSTLVESGRKQGWSGFKILPSSGMQVWIQVSKKGTSAPVLDSDRITWERRRVTSRVGHLPWCFLLPFVAWRTGGKPATGKEEGDAAT